MIDVKEIAMREFKELEFLEEKHYYKLNGKYIPSVSSVIKSISSQIYGDIDKEILKKAADRGTEVHLAVEIYDTTGAEVISDEFVGYLDAYKKFRHKYPNLKPIANEYRVYEPTLYYAGTIDKIYIDTVTDKLILVDLKTSYNIELATLIPQLTGYNQALKAHGIMVNGIYVLQLKNSGEYEYQAVTPNYDLLLHCLSIYNHVQKYKKWGA